MGTTRLLQFPSSATAPSSNLPLPLINSYVNPLNQSPIPTTCKFSNSTRCRSTGYGGRPRWDSNAEEAIGPQRFRFNIDDDDDDGGEDGFGFRRGSKKRVWWSDDSMGIDDDVEGFGVLEESIDASWIFKVLNAFGWMLPAIGISMLLGTGPNAFFMALVLPIAQSAVTFATDAFWGRSSGSPKQKRRTKKKPFARAASDIGMGKKKEDIFESVGKGRENYQSWGAANDASNKKSDDKKRRANSFGGWDDLDKAVGSDRVPKMAQKNKKGKLSRRVRIRETPLLLRLLVAVFPFLGWWNKFL